jgi:hypothetical protein
MTKSMLAHLQKSVDAVSKRVERLEKIVVAGRKSPLPKKLREPKFQQRDDGEPKGSL